MRWTGRHLAGSVLALAVPAAGAAGTQAFTVPLWPGTPPGATRAAYREQVFHGTPVGTVVTDVGTPTLTAYLPDRANATGTGVIVLPGGACIALVIDREGHDVARRLQRMGIAAFVLKYRLQHKQGQGVPRDLSEDVACRPGIADGVQAVRLVRRHAAQWGVAPDRVGVLGFSAGGMIASEVLLQKDAAARPDFAALIYGAPFESMPPVPVGLPPVFMAWARDDDTAGYAMARFYQALLKAGDKPEAHIYGSGGHGFAAAPPLASSAHWLQECLWWLRAQKLLGPPTKR
jgi:acetyl esterase/lipase